jgi:tRNA A-37 threonylcarbamoyl transferase component Bud32
VRTRSETETARTRTPEEETGRESRRQRFPRGRGEAGTQPDPDEPVTVARDPVDHRLAEEPLTLGRYTLGKRLGSGGFATVYAAHDERLDRQVAIKVLARARVIHSRFEREARAAARLHHPSIVTLFEAAVDDDGAYLVSELVRGTTLDRALALGELSDAGILEVAVALADALEHAHGNDVVHRDVKPQNVLIPARRGKGAGGLPVAKLTDFGVARVLGGDTLTRTGDVVGTMAYMSPEQAEGRDAGPPADLYSLALLTYEALTGVNPVADSLRHGAQRRLGAYLPPIRRQRADLPRHLGAALDQALRPRPSERGSLAELRVALVDSIRLVDDVPGVVAPARAITVTRRPDDEDAVRPAPEWTENPRRRSVPAVEPTADSRTQTLALRPGGLLLLTAGLLAVGLGALGLAGAWPALVTQTVRGWWRRAILGAGGLVWLGVANQLVPRRNFYYALLHLTPVTLRPVAVAALVWALAAALAPVLMRGRSRTADLILATLIAVAVPVALTAGGLHHVNGLVPGALLGWLIGAHRPLIGQVRAAIAPRALP